MVPLYPAAKSVILCNFRWEVEESMAKKEASSNARRVKGQVSIVDGANSERECSGVGSGTVGRREVRRTYSLCFLEVPLGSLGRKRS